MTFWCRKAGTGLRCTSSHGCNWAITLTAPRRSSPLRARASFLSPRPPKGSGLALHELATNAAKYGALSTPAGNVTILWRRLPAQEGHGIELLWRESGGPNVSVPDRRGFGTLVIERHLARSLDTEVSLGFAAEGVHCRIIVPVTQFVAAPET